MLKQVKDAERIKDFILKHSPHVLLVGATNMHCRQLQVDLIDVRDNILEHNPQFLTRSETGDVDITYADETLAALWQSSAAAQAEMGDQPPLVRRAVSLQICTFAIYTTLIKPTASSAQWTPDPDLAHREMGYGSMSLVIRLNLHPCS